MGTGIQNGERVVVDEIVLVFRYTEEEYKAAVRLFYARTLRLKMDLLLSVLALILGAAGSWLGLGPHFSVLLIVCALALIGMIAYAMLVIPRRFYNSNPKLKDEYTITFSEGGIRFHTHQIESRIDWSFYKSVVL